LFSKNNNSFLNLIIILELQKLELSNFDRMKFNHTLTFTTLFPQSFGLLCPVLSH